MADSFDPGLIPFFTVQYSSALELLLQQTKSKLRGSVREGAFVGKAASPINQVGALTAKAPVGRFAPLPVQEAPLARRWLFPQPFELPQLVDSFDELQTIVDPKSMFAEAAAAAFNRVCDDIIIAAATGTATLGVDQAGFTTETFNTASTQSGGFQVPVNFKSAAASGLIVDKIIEAKRVLRHFHNDLEAEMPTLVIGSQQESDLLNQAQVVSTEFNPAPVFRDGVLTRIFGCNLIVSERLPYSVGAANQRGVLMYVKSGVHFGTWKDMQNKITLRDDLSGEPWQIATRSMYGASRMQVGKVVQILCSDSTGADINP